MNKKFIIGLLCSTLISSVAFAGLEDGIKAFEQKKYDKAFEEFSYLADENNNIAAYHLGLMYENGLGVEPSLSTAAEFYLKAYNAGNTLAASKLGRFLIEGKEIDKNVEDGMMLLKTAGRSGDKEALFTLGELYNNGEFLDKDYVIAGAYFKLAALQGFAPAQHQLALLFLFGRGMPQDYSLAMRWLGRSASQGYVPAQKDIADLLSTNPRMLNVVEAYAWYSIMAAYNTDETGLWAAEKRDALAGRIKDTKNLIIAQQLAREWRPTPAVNTVPEIELSEALPIIPGFNDADTLRELKEQNAIVLADGSAYGIMADDVEQALIKNDTQKLEDIINDWGKNGRPDAFTYWGKIVEQRLQNPEVALTWYTRAAEGGDAEGAFYVAKAYCEGKLKDVNPVECYKWLQIAKSKAEDPLLTLIEQTMLVVEAQIQPEEKEVALKAAETFSSTKKKEKKSFKLF
ncbi:MAG: sel1 repeat family protein [Alphaproteobacteria bacterium]|nr:sel1 repeat family protein [Alphaproteobacteria bacterium]